MMESTCVHPDHVGDRLLPPDAFYWIKRTQRPHSWCRVCCARAAALRRETPAAQETRRRWAASHPLRLARQKKEWAALHRPTTQNTAARTTAPTLEKR